VPSSSERTHAPKGAGGKSEVFAKVRGHGAELADGDVNVKKGVGGPWLRIASKDNIPGP